MIIIIEGISTKALNRLTKNPLGDEIAWIEVEGKGEDIKNINVCLSDERYTLFTGTLFDKRDYVEIRHYDHAYVLMTGEFNRVIVE